MAIDVPTAEEFRELRTVVQRCISAVIVLYARARFGEGERTVSQAQFAETIAELAKLFPEGPWREYVMSHSEKHD
jgi:hypothetical protein